MIEGAMKRLPYYLLRYDWKDDTFFLNMTQGEQMCEHQGTPFPGPLIALIALEVYTEERITNPIRRATFKKHCRIIRRI